MKKRGGKPDTGKNLFHLIGGAGRSRKKKGKEGKKIGRKRRLTSFNAQQEKT